MIRNFRILAGMLLLSLRLTAQDSTRALLWEISAPGLGSPSYLFGTVHMIPRNDFFLPAGLERCFEASHTLYLELDMNEMSDMGRMMGIMDKCYMKDGKTLSGLLSPEDYALVKTKMEEMGIPAMMFERMKPMFLTSLAGMDDGSGKGINAEDVRSYEIEFTERARQRRMALKGIESIEFQLSIFDSIPYEVQAKSLVESFSNEAVSDSTMKEMISWYKSGDIGRLAGTAGQEDESMQPYMNMILHNRNLSWVPRMEEAMKAGSCFFAFGAGHLGGPDGLISLLRKKSYHINPVLK